MARQVRQCGGCCLPAHAELKARSRPSRQLQQMRPLRVYCIEETGGCRNQSLTSSTGDIARDVMRRRQVLVFAAGAAALLGTGSAQAAPATTRTAMPSTTPVATSAAAAGAAGTWRAAIEVPGTGGLNKGGNAAVTSVSCASAGNCAAGGLFTHGSGDHQGFVASEGAGTWHAAIEVPGTAALNKGGFAEVDSVSCASAGNCLAGGFYFPAGADQQAFVASERGGTWHAAIEVPGTAALNIGRSAAVLSVSCASAGNCAAGGDYNHFDHQGPAVLGHAKGRARHTRNA